MTSSRGCTMGGLAYATAGDGGSPVLLIMGFGVPGHLWAGQVETLRQHHHVAWFDNRGTGMSRKQGRVMTMADMRRDAIDVMDALGWESVHLVGVSMGGMIAQELALAAPARIRSLTLITTHAGGLRNLTPPPPGLALFLAGFMGPRRLRSQALSRLIFPSDYRPSTSRDGVLNTLRTEVAEAGTRRDRLTQISAIVRHRTADRLHRLEGLPTLVVAAGRDRLVRPKETIRLHHLIPGSRLVVFEHAGHGILSQCADEVNALLLEHFREVDAASAPAQPAKAATRKAATNP